MISRGWLYAFESRESRKVFSDLAAKYMQIMRLRLQVSSERWLLTVYEIDSNYN
jgi:hypothetical protein